MTLIAAGTKLEQIVGQAVAHTAPEGERFVLVSLPEHEAELLADYLEELEAERIMRESQPDDWIPLSELPRYIEAERKLQGKQ
jgi:hypothetical protein